MASHLTIYLRRKEKLGRKLDGNKFPTLLPSLVLDGRMEVCFQLPGLPLYRNHSTTPTTPPRTLPPSFHPFPCCRLLTPTGRKADSPESRRDSNIKHLLALPLGASYLVSMCGEGDDGPGGAPRRAARSLLHQQP